MFNSTSIINAPLYENVKQAEIKLVSIKLNAYSLQNKI